MTYNIYPSKRVDMLNKLSLICNKIHTFNVVSLINELINAGISYPDRVLFKNSITFDSAISDINRVDVKEKDGNIRVFVFINYLTLFTDDSIFPAYMQDYILAKGKDSSIVAFVDIMVDRAVKNHYEIAMRSNLDNSNPWMRNQLLAYTMSDFDIEISDFCYQYSGVLSKNSLSPNDISEILTHYFNVPITCEDNHGSWHYLEAYQCASLGKREVTLGVDVVLGAQVWSANEDLMIIIGPLNFSQYLGFLQGGKSIEMLNKLLQILIKSIQTVKVKLILAVNNDDAHKLCSFGDSRLGYTSALVCSSFELKMLEVYT